MQAQFKYTQWISSKNTPLGHWVIFQYKSIINTISTKVWWNTDKIMNLVIQLFSEKTRQHSSKFFQLFIAESSVITI